MPQETTVPLPIFNLHFKNVSWINNELTDGPWNIRTREPFSTDGTQVSVTSKVFPHLSARYMHQPWNTQTSEFGKLELQTHKNSVVSVITQVDRQTGQQTTSIHIYAVSNDRSRSTVHIVYLNGKREDRPLDYGCLSTEDRKIPNSVLEEKDMMREYGFPNIADLPQMIDSEAVLRAITDVAVNGFQEDITKSSGKFSSLFQAGL